MKDVKCTLIFGGLVSSKPARKTSRKAAYKFEDKNTFNSRLAVPRGVSEVVDGLRLPAAVKEHLKHSQVWSKWAEIVGPDLSRVTFPLELRARVLIVSVAHQAWAQQLHFLKPSILTNIRSICRDADIKDVQFRVGKVPVQTLKKSNEDAFDKTETKSVPLSERQEMTLRAVEDPELRESIRRAMEAAQGRQKFPSS